MALWWCVVAQLMDARRRSREVRAACGWLCKEDLRRRRCGGGVCE